MSLKPSTSKFDTFDTVKNMKWHVSNYQNKYLMLLFLSIILNMATGLFSARIKHMVEKTIERKINTIFRKIETGFNDLMARYPPAQLKNIVEEKLTQATGLTTETQQMQS